MSGIKTHATDGDVTAFLDSVDDPRRRAEAHELRALFEEVSGDPGTLWGPSIVGFGASEYTNTSGTHPWFVFGFSPRKAALTLYGMQLDSAGSTQWLERLGPHSTGRGCLYLRRLAAVDHAVLSGLLRAVWATSQP